VQKSCCIRWFQNGIGTWNDDLVDFDIPHDRLQTALFAITLGATN
jgi:hypothetical protein